MREKPHILIVDDLEQNLLALGRTLSEVDAQIVKARSGNEALAASLNHTFALAILDVYMPEMDGYELAGLLRSDQKTRHLPIIFLTASHPEEEHVFRGYTAGAVDYILKPYNAAVLVSKVKVFLELHQNRAELEDMVRRRTAELEENQRRLQDRVEELAAVALDNFRRKGALQKSEERYRVLFESTKDAIMILEPPSWQFTSANPATLEMFGVRNEADLTSRPPWEYSPEYQPDGRPSAEKAREMIDTAMREGSHSFEWQHKRLGGEEFPVTVLLTRMEIEGRCLLQATVRDVSKQRQLEAQMRQAQKMEAVGRLAGGVAHDFNNQILIVRGYAQLLERALEDPRHREILREIRRAADQSANLTRQLLAFSRKQILSPEILDLNRILADLQKMLGRLIGEDIEIVTVLANDLWLVTADPGQVEQIIMNLAVNARDAMPHGGRLTIETANVERDEAYASTHEGAQPGSHVMLAITDTGCGMDAAILQNIFDPFFTTKEPGKGTGLGLATVHGIVHQSGGHIEVESKPGKGTSFRIFLPRTEDVLVVSAEEDEEEELVRAGHQHVLVVEDEPALRPLIATMLGELGYQVTVTADGEEALHAVEREGAEPSVLLTDVIMPGMSGAMLAKRLCEIRPQLKVVYMSGYTDDALSQHDVRDPGTLLLQKPFTAGSLAAAMKKLLGG